jgi:hypothetical protein
MTDITPAALADTSCGHANQALAYLRGLMSLPVCTLDLEASGFGRGSYPIEVGFVRDDGHAFCTLIKPAAHWTHWNHEAGALHGITRAVLASHGREAVVVATLLNEQLAGRVVYSDAWAHDYSWLGALYDEAGLQPSFKLESVLTLLDEQQRAGLRQAHGEALAALGLARHRASNDARALQMALQKLRRSAVPAA